MVGDKFERYTSLGADQAHLAWAWLPDVVNSTNTKPQINIIDYIPVATRVTGDSEVPTT